MSENINKVSENAVNGGETKKDVRDMERKQRDAREAGKAIVKNWVFWGLVVAVLFLGFSYFQHSAEISALKIAVGGIEKHSDTSVVQGTDGLVSRVSHIEDSISSLSRDVDELSKEKFIKMIVNDHFPGAVDYEIINFWNGQKWRIYESGNDKFVGYGDNEFVLEPTKFVNLCDCIFISGIRGVEPPYGLGRSMIAVKDKSNKQKYIFWGDYDQRTEILPMPIQISAKK